MIIIPDNQIFALYQNGDLQYFSKWRETWEDIKEPPRLKGANSLKEFNYRLRRKSTQIEIKY